MSDYYNHPQEQPKEEKKEKSIIENFINMPGGAPMIVIIIGLFIILSLLFILIYSAWILHDGIFFIIALIFALCFSPCYLLYVVARFIIWGSPIPGYNNCPPLNKDIPAIIDE
jgi:hypothetical protein